MPRSFLSRWMPDPQTLRRRLSGKWYLRPFKELIYEPSLWRANRRSTQGALAMGLFICCMPVPGHTLYAILGSLWWRLNLPLAFITVWFNNPFTMGAIYYGSYKLGSRILGVHALPFRHHHFSFGWLLQEAGRIWQPLLLGCVIIGLAAALVGYIALSVAWQISIRSRWHHRQRIRKQRTDRG
ncbi:MAG: DUF2062 domain-containing protein [Gammaproteobacteria bacterium]